VDIPSRPHFHRNGTRQIAGHALEGTLEFVLTHHESCSRSFVTEQVQWTTQVHVHKVYVRIFFDKFRDSRELVGMGGGQLYTKYIFARMPFEKGPFSWFSFQEVRGYRHFSAGNIRTKLFHDSTKGKISHRCQRCYVNLVGEVDNFFGF